MSDPAVSTDDHCPVCKDPLLSEALPCEGIGGGGRYRYYCPRCTDEAKTLNLSGLLEFHGVVRRGDVLVVQATRHFSNETWSFIGEQVKLVFEKHGVGMIVLDENLRVAGTKPPPAEFGLPKPEYYPPMPSVKPPRSE
jgi:hypothetical protein